MASIPSASQDRVPQNLAGGYSNYARGLGPVLPWRCPMLTKVRCPKPECGMSVDVPQDSLGRVSRCKRCGTRFTLSPSSDVSPASPGTAEAVAPVKVVGRYQVRENLGSGAFGMVYRAYDPQLDRDVALKVLRPEVLASKQAVERFQREARTPPRCTTRTLCPFSTPASTANTSSSPRL